MPSTRGDRILIVRLGAIGDALRVLPALRRLRIERPTAVLAWAVEDWVYPLLAGNPNIDTFHVLNRALLRAGRGGLMEINRFVREVRAGGYTIALDFHGRLKSGLVTRASGAATRIGYARSHCTEGNHLFTNVHVALADPLENRVLRFLHLLRPLGIDATFDVHDTGVWLPADSVEHARQWYAETGRPMIAVYPGTSTHQGAYHRWPAEKWIDLLRLLGTAGMTSTVFWGPDEADEARAIVAAVPAGCRLAPPTTLVEMMAMLAEFRAFIGSNTAAMHMAWLQGVPTAVFVGPAEPRTDAPLPPVPSRALRADAHVTPGRSKRHQADAVREVGVEDARQAVQELLAGASPL